MVEDNERYVSGLAVITNMSPVSEISPVGQQLVLGYDVELTIQIAPSQLTILSRMLDERKGTILAALYEGQVEVKG